MNKELLLDSFTCLDDDLIARSERAPRAALTHALRIAACFALLAAVVAAPLLARQRRTAAPPAATEIAWDKTDRPDIAPMIKSYEYQVDIEPCYAAPQNGEVNRSMPLRGAMDEYGDGARYRVIVELFRNEAALPADGAEVQAEIERFAALGYTVAYETLSGEGQRTRHWFTLHATYDQLAEFPALPDYGYMLFLYGERENSSDPNTLVTVSKPQLSTGQIPEESVEVRVAPLFPGETLTQEQAYADAEFGAYLCGAPAGFADREFTRTSDVLTANFLRGYDYVRWSVRTFREEDRERLVTAVAETERYDVSLYSIPYAESVPADIRVVFDHPIFRIEDLTPDIVRARAYRINDSGDSDGWRCSFSVLCGDVLVQISAKGVAPEWLYEQLASLR